MSDSLRRHGLCLPGSFVHRNFQARVLEWLAVSFSRVSSPPRDQTQVSCIAGRFLTTEPLESENESHLVTSNSLQPHGLYSPWNSPGQNTGVGSLSLLQEIFATQGLGRPPTLQMDSLPAEPQEKPKNTGVGRIFLTQESNQSLLHCRWILYQLSYQGMYYL